MNTDALKKYIDNIDHHEIYKLHMAQARHAKKRLQGNPEALAKLDLVIEKVKQTYKDACKQ